ncbi:unnamed protein product [Orchesella dallaii]|uniref:Uncharacterized protein n=1 Tax=Orchesella dallaii TaxID=48710 RepID=A0ABP1Q8X3_9HEXA
MVLSPCKSRLLTCTLMACVFPFVQSLSIPPTPSTVVVQDNDAEEITSTLIPITKEDGDGDSGLVFTGDDEQSQDVLEQSTGLRTKDSIRHVPSDVQPTSQQSLEGTSTDDTNKIEATTESDVSGEQNANLNETLSGQRPVLEMVDIVLRPFQPPSVLILDFFRKSNNTRKTGSGSDEDDSGSIESNKGSNDSGNDDEVMSSSALTSTTEGISVIDPLAQDKTERRRRETHQLGNNSTEDGDDDAPSAKSDNNKAIRSSISSKVTGKFQADDTTTATTTVSNNDDDSTGNDDDDNDASHNTSANKTGTIKKVFLEILQLVPLFGSNSDEDDGSPTTTISTNNGVAHSGTDENDGTGASTVIHSSKANSNQKFSSANSTTGETKEVGKASRVA